MLAEVPLLSASGGGRGCDLIPRLKPFLALITTTGPRYEVYRHAWEIKKKQQKDSMREYFLAGWRAGGRNINRQMLFPTIWLPGKFYYSILFFVASFFAVEVVVSICFD